MNETKKKFNFLLLFSMIQLNMITVGKKKKRKKKQKKKKQES